ncbi:MAG: hypothetical protein QXD34_01835 [Candidatus Bathyarchaeia archaeon]
MNCSLRMFERFLGRLIEVRAEGFKVKGRLVHVDCSNHNGFGNLILETVDGLAVIRGSTVQGICEVEKA